MKCKHKWNNEPPTLGETFCSECGTLYKGLGRPRKNASAKVDILAGVAADMVGAVPEVPVDDTRTRGDSGGITLGGMDSGVNPGLVHDSTPKPPPTWCKMAGKRIAQAFVMLVEGGAARFAKRQTASPEPEDVEELGTALGEQMAIWFPDSEMTPLAKIGLAAASVSATMIVGSKPIQPKRLPVPSAGSQSPTADVAPVDETHPVNGQAAISVGASTLGEF